MGSEYIGWCAMVVTCLSFVPKNVKYIRLINSIACVLWILYGSLIKVWPTVGVNVVVLLIHIIWFIKYKNE